MGETVRSLDHLVIAVRDLAAARSAYARLGFTPTPTARHPFGTENALVQLDACYLELLAVADPALIPEPTATRFSFAAFNRDFLADGEGLSMLVLQSRDAEADRADFARRGLRVYDPAFFERAARSPDGAERKVAFSLAFTSDPRLPRAGVFACQHHFPENFWRAEYQDHANGARTVASVVLCADEPDSVRDFLVAVTGAEEARAVTGGFALDLANMVLEVLVPPAASEAFGIDVAPLSSPQFIGIRMAVAGRSAVRRNLMGNGIACRDLDQAVVVAPADGAGVAIAFV